jgi:hypothetical protein
MAGGKAEMKKPVCPNGCTAGFNCIGDAIMDCVTCNAKPVFVESDERLTPLTESRLQWPDSKSDPFVDADFARDLERKLAQVTEERDAAVLFRNDEGARWQIVATKAESERDTALAKLAKCREALKQIVNCGQSIIPDHWEFRVKFRALALETLKQTE